MTRGILGLACVLLASLANAHPGHGATPAASWLHGLEPVHALPALLGAAALAYGLRRARARRAASRERRR